MWKTILIAAFAASIPNFSESNSEKDPPPPFITATEFAAARRRSLPPANTSTVLNLPPYGNDTMRSTSLAQTRAMGTNLWTNAQIPYTIDSGFNQQQRAEVAKAIDTYHYWTCVRFVPKENHHRSWVDIQYDPNVCGLAHMCMNNGGQFAKFGGGCATAGVMVHELGHTLCMGHEQTRQDRDLWIDWDRSKCEPHGKDGLTQGLHKLYDYVSVEHYEGECYNGCIIPKEPGVTKCGSGGSLSVLDVELINEMYGCNSGWYGYRWVNSKRNPKNPINDAGNEPNGDVLQVCRAYHNGDIIPGKWNPKWEQCFVAYNGGEHRKTGDYIEILTNPHGVNQGWQYSNEIPYHAVPGGRTAERETLYVISCKVEIQGKPVWIPGKYQPSTGAYTSFGGGEVKCNDFMWLLFR